MNFSAIGVTASRMACWAATSDVSQQKENCRDFVDVSRATLQVPNGLWIPRELVASRIPRNCGATITRDESAILVKDHETWDASNLAPRTQLVLALPVAVVQGQPRLLTKILLECLTIPVRWISLILGEIVGGTLRLCDVTTWTSPRKKSPKRPSETNGGRRRQPNYLVVSAKRERSTWLQCRHVGQVNTCVSRCVLLCGTALVPRCMNV